MIDELIQNEHFRRYFPPVAAAGLIALFVSLGSWQLDRAAEKNGIAALFEDDAPVARVTGAMPVTEFQNIEARGHYLDEKQVLIDNMFLDGRVGYYALVPFRYAPAEPLLIVNRGWLEKKPGDDALPALGVGGDTRTIRGRAGYLPKVGVRSRPAFAESADWPRIANYPALGELSAELGEDLLPFVLLLGPEQPDGFLRRWQPGDRGPMMHYGYAIQWFAMAAAVLGLAVWRIRKKRS